MCDMAHFSGLVAAGLHPNPVPHCDFVTSTTHKTLAGPRAGFVLCREEHASKLDRANFPGMQGGPLMHTIAAKAACFRIAMTDAFRDYQRQVRANADALAAGLDRRRLRRPHRRHRHAPRAARPARDRVDGPRRAGAARGVQADREPQHGAVRRAAADGRLGRPPRHAGGDDARLRRGRTSARSRRSSSTRCTDDADVDALRGRARGALRRAAAVPGLPRLHDRTIA